MSSWGSISPATLSRFYLPTMPSATSSNNSSANSSAVSLHTAATSPPRSRAPSPEYNPLEIRDTICVLENPHEVGLRRHPLEVYPTAAEINARIVQARQPGSVENWDDLWLNDAIIAQSRRSYLTHFDCEFPTWMRRMMSDANGDEGWSVSPRHVFMAARLFAIDNRRRIERNDHRLNRILDDSLQREGSLLR